MEILGVGFSEIIFILIIAIIVLGPQDMQKAGRTIGRWLNWFTKSEFGTTLHDVALTISNLPTKLMSDANAEEWGKDLDLQNMIEGRKQKTKYTSSLKSPHHPKAQTSHSPVAKTTKLSKTKEEEEASQTAEHDE